VIAAIRSVVDLLCAGGLIWCAWMALRLQRQVDALQQRERARLDAAAQLFETATRRAYGARIPIAHGAERH
jgi:hypothetical protein